MLAELAVTDRIRVRLAKPTKRHRFHPYDDTMVITDPTPHGDPEADAVLTDNRQYPQWPVLRLVGRAADDDSERYQDESTLGTRLLHRFVERGMLRINHTKTLGLVAGTYNPIVDDSAATGALTRLGQVLHGEIPDVRTGALAILLAPPGKRTRATAMRCFPERARPRAGLFRRLRDGDWCEKSLLETLTAIVAACLV